MQYYSTKHSSPLVDFKEAAIKGQAPDKGLYFPSAIPVFPPAFLKDLGDHSREAIAMEVIKPYTGNTIPKDVLEKIVSETISFDFPLVQLEEDIYALELFHGPTLAFKDVGARFMSRCLEYFVRNNDRKVIVLTATSGDTGGAVADGFYRTPGIDVVVLYPSGKVSSVQELQLTSLGHNIHALEINGSFDDCQRLVKQAFADTPLNAELMLTSANSINVARWLPQQFYYFFALQQWTYHTLPVISVPSGNFGNICAGLLAQRSGLPVSHFIAACNENDTVPQYLQTGKYEPKKPVATISNAMDVGEPSNFIRVLEVFGNKTDILRQAISGCSITGKETETAIADAFHNTGYVMDPHGAVGYISLKKYLSAHPGLKGIFLETAHPIKFQDTIERVTGKKPEMPGSLQSLMQEKKQSLKMDNDYDVLRNYLTDEFRLPHRG